MAELLPIVVAILMGIGIVAPIFGAGGVLFLWGLWRESGRSWLLWAIAFSSTVAEVAGIYLVATFLLRTVYGITNDWFRVGSIASIVALELAPVFIAWRLRIARKGHIE